MSNKFEEIALDKDENVEIFKHKKKNIYGFMWHPERNKNYKELSFIIKKIKKMRIILLCAGRSSRTNLGYPKCLYKFRDGEMLVEKNLKILKKLGFSNKEIYFATGFKSNLIKTKTFNKYNYIFNNKFKNTNMVYSFFKVLKKIKSDEVIVIYSDILFEKKCLSQIIKSKHSISTVIDKDWKKKMEKKSNYMEDLEELKIKNSKIYSLGKKTFDLKDIDGRFLGITKFSKKL